MTGSSEESDNQADVLPGEQLWRKRTAPPGVIDVRFGQQKYFRIVGWLARRTALVAHLRSRYGIEETQAHGEHPFAVHYPFRQQLNLLSTTIQTFSTTQSFSPSAQATIPDAPQNQTGWNRRPSGLAEIIAERSLKPAAEQADSPEQAASPEKKFRISRRPPMMPLKSDAGPTVRPTAVTSGASLSQQAHAETGAPRAESFSGTESPSRDTRVNETQVNEAPIINQTPPDLIFRKSDAESPGVEKSSDVTRISAQRSVITQEHPASAQEKSALALSSGEQVGSKQISSKQVGSEQIGEASSIAEQGAREITNAAPPLILVKPLASAFAAGASNAEPLLSSQSAGGARSTQSGDAAAQKEIDHPPGSKVDDSPVVAHEIRGDSFNAQRPDVVWRTSPDGSQAAGFMAQKFGAPVTPSVDEYDHNASAPATQQSYQTCSTANVQPAGPEAQSKEVRVEHISPQVIRAISERVMRTLTLDLKHERERRGGTKWR